MLTTDNKININAAEKELGKGLCKIFKGVTGRGAISYEARIVNQSIFIQYNIERLPTETMLFGFIQMKNLEYEFFDQVRPDFIAVTNILMRQLNTFLSVEGMEFRIDDNTTYMLITLNKNLEKMLLSGEAKLSHIFED